MVVQFANRIIQMVTKAIFGLKFNLLNEFLKWALKVRTYAIFEYFFANCTHYAKIRFAFFRLVTLPVDHL